MTDPTLWGDAVSQVIWTYYLANFVYGLGIVFSVVLGGLALWYGGVSIMRWHVYRDDLQRKKTGTQR